MNHDTPNATVIQSVNHRHIGGSILPPSDSTVLIPIATDYGVLQVRALPDLDIHALFLTHDRGECLLAMHSNGYSCHALAKNMATKDGPKVRAQVQHILNCGGLAMGIDFILGWLGEPVV